MSKNETGEPAGRYRLKIYIPHDLAPDFAKHWALYRRGFEYHDDLQPRVEIVTTWIGPMDCNTAVRELLAMNLFPKDSSFALIGPLEDNR